MNETVRHSRVEGEILLDGENIFELDVSRCAPAGGHGVSEIQPVPEIDFRQRRLRPADQRLSRPGPPCAIAVEQSLRRAALWDEVKDKLHQSAYGLSAASSSGCASRGRWP